jgi:hypothetical protein
MSEPDNESLPGFIKNMAMITSSLRVTSRRVLLGDIVKVQSWMRWVASAGTRSSPAHFAHLYGVAAVDVARALVRRRARRRVVCGGGGGGGVGVAHDVC